MFILRTELTTFQLSSPASMISSKRLFFYYALVALILLSIAGLAYVFYIAIFPIWLGFLLILALSIHYFLKETKIANIFSSLLFPTIYGLGMSSIIFIDASWYVCDAGAICGNETMLTGFFFFVTLIITAISLPIVGIINGILYLQRNTEQKK